MKEKIKVDKDLVFEVLGVLAAYLYLPISKGEKREVRSIGNKLNASIKKADQQKEWDKVRSGKD